MLVVAANLAAAAPGVLIATTVKGEVRVEQTGAGSSRLRLHDVRVAGGATIETGDRGRATLALSNGTGLDIGPGTRVAIASFAQEPFTPDQESRLIEPGSSELVIGLERGRIALSTVEMNALSRIEVVTAAGRLRIHDGRCTLAHDDGRFTVAVYRGNYTFRYTDGESRDFLNDGDLLQVDPTSSGGGEPLFRGTVDASDVAFEQASLAARSARERVVFRSPGNAASGAWVASPVLIVPPAYHERPPAQPFAPAE